MSKPGTPPSDLHRAGVELAEQRMHVLNDWKAGKLGSRKATRALWAISRQLRLVEAEMKAAKGQPARRQP